MNLITSQMVDKAQRLIASDATTAHRANGCCYPGAKRKRHKPYALPGRATAMLEALDSGDPERVAALLLTWDRLSVAEGAPP